MIRRILLIICLLLSVAAAGYVASKPVERLFVVTAQPPTIRITGVVYSATGAPAANISIRFTPYSITGSPIASAAVVATTDSSGNIQSRVGSVTVAYLDLVRGGTYRIEAPILGFSAAGGALVTLPNTSTADFSTLVTVTSYSSSGLTVKNSGVALSGLYTSVNFKTGIQAVNNAGVADVSLIATGVTPGTYNATNLTVDAYGRITAASTGGSAAVVTTLGDTLYATGPGALARLPGNTSATKKFLSQTGNGTISAAPVWDTITDPNWGNIGGTLSAQVDLQAALDAKQASLGFTPENVANKATSFSTLNNTLYPTTQAVSNFAVANYQPLSANLTTYASIAPSANVQTLLGAADYAAFRSSLGVPTNGASANFIPKSDGTNLVASRISDDGTDIFIQPLTGTVILGDNDLAGQSQLLVVDNSAGDIDIGSYSPFGADPHSRLFLQHGVTTIDGTTSVKVQSTGTVSIGNVDNAGTRQIIDASAQTIALTAANGVSLPTITAGVWQGTTIAYNKLSLTGSIVNADISASAAIAYSKLALTGAILNADLAGSIANNKLANSTISGVSLGSNLATLTIGTGLSGTSYNGSAGVTIATVQDIATTATPQFTRLGLGAAADATAVLNASGSILQTSASASAFVSGPNGATNPVFKLVNNVTSAATGLSVTGNAAGSGVTLTALSSGSNENISITAKGSAYIAFPSGNGSFGGDSYSAVFGSTTVAGRIAQNGAAGNAVYNAFYENSVLKWYFGNTGAALSSPNVSAFSIANGSFGTNSQLLVNTSGAIVAQSGGQFAFSSTTSASGTKDTGIARDSAGVIRITDGSTGGGAVMTVDPTSGNGPAWKLGARKAATVTLDTTQYIEVSVGGVTYKLAIVN